ncbi:hypothetical protein [Aquabacterium sp.]
MTQSIRKARFNASIFAALQQFSSWIKPSSDETAGLKCRVFLVTDLEEASFHVFLHEHGRHRCRQLDRLTGNCRSTLYAVQQSLIQLADLNSRSELPIL